jgi:hypothetical protein
MKTLIRRGVSGPLAATFAWRSFTLSACAALATMLSVAGVSQAQSQSASANAPSAPQPEQPASHPGGPYENIKVHGHWVIEVRNPDGSLAARREFENALVGSGQLPLSDILSGYAVPAGWVVQIWDPTSNTTAIDGGPCHGRCWIQQQQLNPHSPCTKASCSSNLTASLSQANNQIGLVLSGWIQATQAGNISEVDTINYFCAPAGKPPSDLPSYTSSPQQCAASGPYSGAQFTSRTLPGKTSTSDPCGGGGESSCEILNVQAKQVVNVSVTITFQ